MLQVQDDIGTAVQRLICALSASTVVEAKPGATLDVYEARAVPKGAEDAEDRFFFCPVVVPSCTQSQADCTTACTTNPTGNCRITASRCFLGNCALFTLCSSHRDCNCSIFVTTTTTTTTTTSTTTTTTTTT